MSPGWLLLLKLHCTAPILQLFFPPLQEAIFTALIKDSDPKVSCWQSSQKRAPSHTESASSRLKGELALELKLSI